VELVDGLVRDGWLREDLYATGRVRSWIRQGYSERAIVSMARREGLDVKPAWVREQFEDLGTDEATQLKRLLVKRSRGGLKAGDEKSRRRILGAAARRGHAPGAASRLLGKGRGDEELPDV
jgi:SOS response regulatory protein OraA/RecX